MSNRYKVLLPLTVSTDKGSWTQGEVFEHEFSEEDELENLNSGLLELQPQRYRIVGESDVFETPPGEVFERAVPLFQERLLMAGGHIERVDDPVEEPVVKPPRKTKPKE